MGNPIDCLYPPDIVKKRDILISMKYREATYKPNLFYTWIGKRAAGVIFFCDLRDYGYVSVWRTYTKETPTWMKNRMFLVSYEEEVKLTKNGVPIDNNSDNLYWDGEDETTCNNYNAPNYKHYALYYDPLDMPFTGDGYCCACGKDLEANEYFCSEQCKLKIKTDELELDIIHSEKCEACKRWIVSDSEKYNDVVELLPKLRDKVVLSKVIEHHTCYEKDIKMVVCIRCHAKIHSLDWCEYTPVDSRPINKKKFELVPCSTTGCRSKARIDIGADKSTAKCYRCKKKEIAFNSGKKFELVACSCCHVHRAHVEMGNNPDAPLCSYCRKKKDRVERAKKRKKKYNFQHRFDTHYGFNPGAMYNC